MKLLIVLMFFITTVFSQSKEQNLIPKNIIAMNPIDDETSYAIFMDKSKYELSLYSSKGDNIKKIKSFHAIYGKNLGDKLQQGDHKTPEGIYFIYDIKYQKELLPKYGKAALVLNYPNPIDSLKGKTGIGIWIHSVDDPVRLKKLNDTRGCIAIDNENIMELIKSVHITNTPVIISNKSSYFSPEARKTTHKYFSQIIENWREAWETNDIETYISFYSDNFYSNALKKDKNQWKSYKNLIGNINKNKIKIIIDKLNAYDFGTYATIVFRQKYDSPSLTDTGKKILYLEKVNDKYKIVSESWFKLPKKDFIVTYNGKVNN